VALKKPSEYFKKDTASVDDSVQEIVSNPGMNSFSEAYDSFRNNLSKIDSLSKSLDEYNDNVDKVNYLSEKVSEIQTELKSYLSKEELDRSLVSQLFVVEQSIREVQSKVKSINEKHLAEVKSDVSIVTEAVNNFLDVDVPKYKNLVVESELRTYKRYEELEGNVNKTFEVIGEFVDSKYEELSENLQGINQKNLEEVLNDIKLLDESFKKLKEEDIQEYKKLVLQSEKIVEERVEDELQSFSKKTNQKFKKFNSDIKKFEESVQSKIDTIGTSLKEFVEVESPKYNKLLIENKLKTEEEVKSIQKNLEEKVSEFVLEIEKIKTDSETTNNFVTEKVDQFKDLLLLTREELWSKTDDVHETAENFSEKLIDCVSQISVFKEEFELNQKIQKDLNEEYQKKLTGLSAEIIRNESHIKVQNKHLEHIKEEIKESISKLTFLNEQGEQQNYELGKKVKYIEEVIEKFNEETLLTEGLLDNPKENNSDPLTPTGEKLVTFDDLQNHYRTFVNRIQQQLSTLGGGGETRLKYLDDIVGIATNAAAYDQKFLAYDASIQKFEFKNVPEPSVNLAEENIIYVAKDGDDANDGTLGRPKLTIKAAVQSLVAAGRSDNVVKVAPGTYIEDNPITLPDEMTVMGHSLRETTVIPQNDDKDLFYVGNGNYVAEMSYRGSMPGKAIFAFDPVDQRYIRQSPYIQNCTNFIPESIGMRIDGKDAIGPLKSMVLDSYTQYNQGGIGVSITNEAYAQLVSLFTICDEIAVFAASGGACDLTNSNSSFGDFGLVADGVSGLKYTGIVTVAASDQADTFVVDLSVPTLNVVAGFATIHQTEYNNVTGRIKVVTDQPHKFNVGMAVTLAGLGFTCDFEPGIREYPSGVNGYVFNVETVAPGRYLDAVDRIIANKDEIQDKSLAAIALEHPDFIFPGDPSDDARYRYYDSYRLTQKNRREIIDKSLASIAVGFPSSFYFPDEDETNSQSRFYDASSLITRNKQEIVDKSLAAIALDHEDFVFPGDEAVGGGNTTPQSRFYDSYRLIQKNRAYIVDEAWDDLAATYPDFAYTETKCKRDIGFFIDAVSTDVFTGGNNYSKSFVLQYFDGNGDPITGGIGVTERVPSVYAFGQAQDYMKSAITNTLSGAPYQDLTVTEDPAIGSNQDPNSCQNVQDTIDTLVGIVTVSIGAGDTTSLPTTNIGYFDISAGQGAITGIGTTIAPGGLRCARDIAFLSEAVATDIFTGGNKYSREFTTLYFDSAGNPIQNGLIGEEAESITAFTALADYSKRALTNQLNVKNLGISSGPAEFGGVGIAITVFPSGNPGACIDVQNAVDTLVGIVTTVVAAGSTASLSTFDENLGISTTNKCARDLGFLVDAVSTDLFTGGNRYSRDFTLQYFNNVGAAITNGLLGEEEESVYAFNTLGEYTKKAVTNQLNYKEVGISSGPAEYNGGGGDIAVLPSGNPNSCIDVQNSIDTLVGIVTTVVGAGDTSSLTLSPENTGNFTDVGSVCRRDIGYIIDAVTEDLIGFTNQSVILATENYFTYDGVLDDSIETEIDETITAFEAARDYMKLALNNQLNSKDLTIQAGIASIGHGGEVIPIEPSGSPTACADVRYTVDTLVGIITTNLGNGDLSALPQVSLASTIFTVDVGVATQPHYYNSGGTVKTNVVRPFDGQSLYFNDLYFDVKTLTITDGGSGYTEPPIIEIEAPDTPWGIRAQAVATLTDGVVTGVDMVSNGRGYRIAPKVTISSGINTAVAKAVLSPEYYTIQKSTEITNGISIITINENVPYEVGVGTEVKFYKQSRILATGHSFEFIGAGTDIATCLPFSGGTPPKPENETDARDGGLVVYSSTNQAGNFKIGDGVIINQNTGSISGQAYSKSLLATVTPYILSLGGF